MGLIDKGSMLAPMAALDARLAEVHRAWQKEWADHGDPPPYACLSGFAQVVIKAVAEGDTGLCTKAFDVVEHWLRAGDDYVRQAAIAGFLEDVQNIGLYEGLSGRPDDLVPLLGPEARYWWDKVERFWSHGEAIVDDR